MSRSMIWSVLRSRESALSQEKRGAHQSGILLEARATSFQDVDEDPSCERVRGDHRRERDRVHPLHTQ